MLEVDHISKVVSKKAFGGWTWHSLLGPILSFRLLCVLSGTTLDQGSIVQSAMPNFLVEKLGFVSAPSLPYLHFSLSQAKLLLQGAGQPSV